MLKLASRGMKAVEPYSMSLVWLSLYLLLLLGFPQSGHPMGLFIQIGIGCIVGAAMMVKPWIQYIKYHHDLTQDEAFYSQTDLDWLNKCSSSLYTIDRTGILSDIRHNKDNALLFVVF
jgi:hypothetical protein